MSPHFLNRIQCRVMLLTFSMKVTFLDKKSPSLLTAARHRCSLPFLGYKP